MQGILWNIVVYDVILATLREDIMATINKKSNRDLWVVYYKHPIKGKHQVYFKNKKDAILTLAHWHKVELLVKNDMDWQSELHESENPVTIQEIINLHKK